jgi:hypothetical protein
MIHFAAPEDGETLLSQADAFVEAMSPFDRSARMKTDQSVSVEEFLTFAAQHVLPWKDAEITMMTELLNAIKADMARFSLDLPEQVLLIKTTGDEEGHAAYTRNHAIVFPEHLIQQNDGLKALIVHELFHIATRYRPEIRTPLYGIIGFAPINEIDVPEELQPRKITNPDAPHNGYRISVTLEGQPIDVVPILFSKQARYDVKKGGEFFNYLTFKLLVVEEQDGIWKPAYEEGHPVMVDVKEISGLFEQIGENTKYIIHPEEILADNFKLLVMNKRDVPSPTILEMMENLLTQ